MQKVENILIAGGTGFLGRALQSYFNSKGHQVKLLTRKPKKQDEIYWDAKHIGEWISEIEWSTVLINLTGKSVDCRYTAKNKAVIFSSRLESTAILSEAVRKAENPPHTWLNAASATIYVHADKEKMTEDNGVIGDDFSMRVCKAWEGEFFKEELETTRRVALRTSIVLGKNGGAYPKMKRLAQLGMGGKQGRGKQFISWIHIEDFCRSVDFIIAKPSIVGPINIVAPHAEQNKIFMQKLRKALAIPVGISQPSWLLELGAALIGTETELLLKSRYVHPDYLERTGFKFKFPDLETTFELLK